MRPAAGTTATQQGHKKSVKLRERGGRVLHANEAKECLTDGMEFHHAKRKEDHHIHMNSADFVAKCDLSAQILRDCHISVSDRIILHVSKT